MRRLAEDAIATFPTCPLREIARPGRTQRAWSTRFMARFDTTQPAPAASPNGGAEAVKLLIEKVRRLAHGFRTFDHHRIRILLTASAARPRRPRPPHALIRRPENADNC